MDQSKLLDILKNEIGILEVAFKWFESFLTGRCQSFMIGDLFSDISRLLYDVPQGSVIGPGLFGIYIRSLYPLIQPCKFDIYGFADDHQLLKSFLPIFQVQALDGDVNYCFKAYFLCLNASKIKILIAKPTTLKEDIHIGGMFIDGNCVRFVTSLGIVIDEELSFEQQVTTAVKSSYIIIRKISKIKSFLSVEHLKTLVTSCMFSRLDCCNSIYYGISANFAS